ncbi:MAG: SCP2 sterol-binding domain-containing protein [Thermoanaerobaculum sp.]
MDLAKLFSPEGAEAFRAAVNGDDAFHSQAAGWTTTLGLVAETGSGPKALLVRLAEGVCQAVEPVSEAELEQAEFVLRGSEGVWRGVLSGQMDAVGAVLMGKLKVVKGSVMALSSRTGAARILLEKAKSAVESLG